MSNEIAGRISRCGVVPVVVLDDAAHAVPLGKALLAGGIEVVEFTFRTEAAVAAIRAVAEQLPDMLVGAGTVLTPDQVLRAKRAGAVFAVSPGLNRRVVEAAGRAGLFFMPGVATPSDVESAVEMGLTNLKFFPAEPMGGLTYLKSMAAPYGHLRVRYCPLGGVTTANVRDYLAEPIVLACGGSWIAKRDRIAAEDWGGITRLAADAAEAAKTARGGE